VGLKSPICDLLGIEFPLLAFSHCRDVVVEVSKAGGMGVYGAAGVNPEQLEIELAWIEENIDGKPYGVDLIIPARFEGRGERSEPKPLPEEYTRFVREVLGRHGIESEDLSDQRLSGSTALAENVHEDAANQLLDVAFSRKVGLLANALGVPPGFMRERCKQERVPVAALVGSKNHALKQAQAGVDILVASGGEAGGHCGEVSTLVLVPEICRAVKEYGDIPVLAAGGIVTGQQMAACMAMGAAGAWTGSVWLTTSEAETSRVVKDKMLAATSADTIRSKARSGKYCRLLRSAWTDAWEAPGAPIPLPMPLQFNLTERPLQKILKLADGGHEGAIQLATYFVGQGVGLMDSPNSVRSVVYQFMEEFLEAVERLNGMLDE
jgi:NAD(P)H-dependent flavin oxidoreductase YrpB (nitropropane dioxygenase family)